MSKIFEIVKRYEIWFLRLAVSFPMLWAGVRALINPQDWIGYVPPIPFDLMSDSLFLMLHSVAMIVAAILLISGPLREWVALFAFVNLVGILIFFGLDDITFRDLGLALVALVLTMREYERHLSSAGRAILS